MEKPKQEKQCDPRCQKSSWPPLGDDESLEDVYKEMRSFAKHAASTQEYMATVGPRIYRVASTFRFNQFFDSLNPAKSRTEVLKGLRRMLSALRRVDKLAAANLASVGLAATYCKGYPEDLEALITFQTFMAHGFKELATYFEAALANDEFKRKGRPESHLTANTLLVLGTRDLMKDLAGRYPGCIRETDASTGPLVRTVRAMYRYATGKPAGSFNCYIAQAELAAREKGANGFGLYGREILDVVIAAQKLT